MVCVALLCELVLHGSLLAIGQDTSAAKPRETRCTTGLGLKLTFHQPLLRTLVDMGSLRIIDFLYYCTVAIRKPANIIVHKGRAA